MMAPRTLHASPLRATASAAELLARIEAERPETPFWQRPDGSGMTAGAFLARAREVHGWFAALGLRAGDRIAIITDLLEPFAEVTLAAALGGFTVVPLPVTAAPAFQASLIARASARALVIGPAHWATLLPVFIARGDPMPERIIVDRAVGPLAPGLLSLEDAGPGGEASEVGPPGSPLALFFNNGSRGRAEAAAVGLSELLAGLEVVHGCRELGGGPGRGLHAVVRCPTMAVGFLFDVWRPLVLGLPVLDLSGIRGEGARLRGALERFRPESLSLAARDVEGLLLAPAEGAGAGPLGALGRRLAGAFEGLGRVLDAEGAQVPEAMRRGLGEVVRVGRGTSVTKAWFFIDMPDGETLRRLRHRGIAALRTYHVSESAVPCGLVSESERARGGYRVPEGVAVRILAPGEDGVGEIAVASKAMASRALDMSRELRALELVDGFLPTGDLGRVDAAGRLHVLGTDSFALRGARGAVAAEEIGRCFEGGPWQHLVPIPERLLWPEEAGGSERWVAIVQGTDAGAVGRFIEARNAVVEGRYRLHGLLCSHAPFPVGTHGRLRREALLGALRSAFAAHGDAGGDRSRMITWLSGGEGA